VPILVDSRYRLLDYRGLTACTPNESEVEQALGVRINDDLRTLEHAGREVLATTRMQAVLITRGGRGYAVLPYAATGVRCTQRLEVLARNPLEEQVVATPAIVDGGIILRSRTNVYRVGN